MLPPPVFYLPNILHTHIVMQMIPVNTSKFHLIVSHPFLTISLAVLYDSRRSSITQSTNFTADFAIPGTKIAMSPIESNMRNIQITS